jgi:hypothetical protein
MSVRGYTGAHGCVQRSARTHTDVKTAAATLLTVDFGTPSYEFTANICTYLIF